ncbi:MAG TPA: type II secretion system protein [Candidatus Synoicihabitans sp.]|nr:type II secretion system protein [Candidatus Synoicihabitans sp.]
MALPFRCNIDRGARETMCLRDQRGFTLAEVAVASVVLLFGIASSIVAMQAGFRSVDMARGLTLASQVLQSEIENIRLLSWEDIKGLEASAVISYDKADDSKETASDKELQKRFVVTRTAGPITDNTRLITITATWTTHSDGRRRSRSTFTLYAENGLNDFYTTDPVR